MICKIARYGYIFSLVGGPYKRARECGGHEDNYLLAKSNMIQYRDINYPDCDLYCGKNKIVVQGEVARRER